MTNISFLILLIISIYNCNVCLGHHPEIDKDEVASRVYLGLEINEGEYPYIARIHDYKDKPQIFCTASIIHKNWILTAGHCLNDQPQKVTVGTTTTNGTDGQTYIINSTYVTENYSVYAEVDPDTGRVNLYNSEEDIGLIQLKNSIDLSQPNVKIIQLDDTSTDYDGQDALFIGWGQTLLNTYSPAYRAQFAQGRVINTTECQEAHPNWTVKSSQHICISPLYDSTICPGDAGGPLISYETNKQIGVANHGTCGSKAPSVFQRISVHYSWINETINNQGDSLLDDTN